MITAVMKLTSRKATFTIWVPQTVVIPASKMKEVEREYLEHWGLDAVPDDASERDILNAAERLDLCSLPIDAKFDDEV